jgi:hypothetical protein
MGIELLRGTLALSAERDRDARNRPHRCMKHDTQRRPAPHFGPRIARKRA